VRDVIEVTVTLGDTLLDVVYVTDRARVAGIEIDANSFGAERRERSGLVEVSARRVAAPPRHPLQTTHGDRRSLGYVAVSLAVHLLVWGVAGDPAETLVRPRPEEVQQARAVMITPAAFQSGPSEPGDSPDFALAGGGQPTLGLEGKAGGDSTRATGHALLDRRDQPRITRDHAVVAARNAGILGSTAMRAESFAAIVGSADLSSGFDTKHVQGPLYGGTGEANGTFGLGRSGLGDSAGCQGAGCNGLIGVGRYGTISNGRSVGDNWGGRFTGAAGGRQRTSRVPTVTICGGPQPCVVAVGGLDKALVRRYVRRQLPKIQYCFEKELLANPELEGVVTTEFLIASNGSVQSSTASGVSEPVSTCVADVIKNIEFPRWEAGSTQVHYPFTFRRTNL